MEWKVWENALHAKSIMYLRLLSYTIPDCWAFCDGQYYYFLIRCFIFIVFKYPPLAKALSDLNKKYTQFPTPFLGTVFNALSLGVIHFVRSVSLRNRFLVGWNSSTANQKTSISRFVKLTLRTKWIAPCERASKTVSENGVGNCVHFCLQPLEPFERCVISKEDQSM